MKTIILDLAGCKSLDDIHERIRKAFRFPVWYGKNWSAFWDLLWSRCDAGKVIVRGEQTIPQELSKHIEIMHSCFDDLIEFREKNKEFDVIPFVYEIEN